MGHCTLSRKPNTEYHSLAPASTKQRTTLSLRTHDSAPHAQRTINHSSLLALAHIPTALAVLAYTRTPAKRCRCRPFSARAHLSRLERRARPVRPAALGRAALRDGVRFVAPSRLALAAALAILADSAVEVAGRSSSVSRFEKFERGFVWCMVWSGTCSRHKGREERLLAAGPCAVARWISYHLVRATLRLSSSGMMRSGWPLLTVHDI